LFWRTKNDPFQVRKNRLFSRKGDFFQVRKKIPFSGRQDARNSIRVVLAPRESVLFQVWKNRLFTSISICLRFGKIAFSRRQDARKSFEVVLAPSKSVPFQVRKNRLLNGKSDIFHVRKKSLFQVAKTLEIASGLFRHPVKASPLRFGKIAFSAERANSFRFGKIAFSGSQNARNSFKVVLAPSKISPFRF
jgi:hypothetical protein